jgi:DNA (cytosine-5)-methyltransferase 1
VSLRPAYYNENDPKAAAWLRELIKADLIAPGDVDERSIVDVRASDLAGYRQCHFFAGIGGWSYALRLAGWPDSRECWTFSCPCQPFSSAARGRTVAADMWPHFRRLILASRPRVVFGEQVAAARDWFDGACDDLEAVGYQIGAAVLPACGIGLDHARPRICFVCHADRDGQPGVSVDGEVAGMPWDRGDAGGMVPAHGLPGDVAQRAAFGNAIVPQVAAEVIGAYMDVCKQADAEGRAPLVAEGQTNAPGAGEPK